MIKGKYPLLINCSHVLIVPTKWSSWRDTLTGPSASVWLTWPRPWWRTWTGSTLSPPWWRWEEFALCRHTISYPRTAQNVIVIGDHFTCLLCHLQGMYGIGDEVYLSLPCVLNSSGVGSVINMTLTDEEIAQLKKSADTLWGIQKDLKDL